MKLSLFVIIVINNRSTIRIIEQHCWERKLQYKTIETRTSGSTNKNSRNLQKSDDRIKGEKRWVSYIPPQIRKKQQNSN